MKLLLITLFLTSCGMNVKHKVSGDVDVKVPTEYNVRGTIDPMTFESMCTKKYQDIANSVDRNIAIDQCNASNLAIVQQLINTLNGVPTPTPTPGK
jgi:hypothetical protein